MGRRGERLRPFSIAMGIKHRDYSRKLQRAMSDFGAEESFVRATLRLQEHYGFKVSSEAIRATTLRHGKAIAAIEPKHDPTAKELVTEMDGSFIPVVQSGTAGDRRKGKKVFWREVRVCSARATGKATAVYGATLGTLESCSLLWEQTSRFAGLGPETYVHGVGDGAPWILEKFKENFGAQGEYLLDFFHVSEYLAEAARARLGEKKAVPWLRQQQGRLLTNQVTKVLRSLKTHLEPEECPREKAPVRNAYRYIKDRKENMNYEKARQKKLPIGSGEIESAHRHLVQKRLKIAGAWWIETNAQAMLNLRTSRANSCWVPYWGHN